MNFKPGDRVMMKKGASCAHWGYLDGSCGITDPGLFIEPQVIASEYRVCCVTLCGRGWCVPVAALTLCDPEPVAASREVCICAVGRSRHCKARHYSDPEPETPTVRAEAERPFRVKATIGMRVMAKDAEAARKEAGHVIARGGLALKGKPSQNVEVREVEVGDGEEL